MSVLRRVAAALLVGVVLLAGCGQAKAPKKAPAGGGQVIVPKRPELTPPFESALQALLDMNAAGKKKEFVNAQKAFSVFREHWAKITVELQKEDPKLAQHIEDGAIELDHEFTKPESEIRVYELDEETVKIGRLLSKAAVLLGVPIRMELVQIDPTEELPFNSEKRIEVVLTDHKFTPKVIEVDQHTKVTFVLKNMGLDVHEFALGYYGIEVEDIGPGQTAELTIVTIDAGEFEIACHLPGHYEVGMVGTLKVRPAKLKKQ